MGVATARYHAAIVSCWMTYLANGLTVGYPSTALPDIATGHYGFTFPNGALEAWYISCTPIASFVGTLAVSHVVDRHGRRLGLMIMLAVCAVGWLVTASANGVVALFVGRVIISLTDASQQSTMSILVTELAPEKIRGTAIYGAVTGYLSGIAFSYVFGTFVDWRWLAVISIGFELVAILSVWLFVPETPRWLVMRGERELAKSIMQKLRNNTTREEQIESEIQAIEASMGKTTSFVDALKRLLQPPLLRPFVLVNMAYMFQQMSGTAYIKSFTVKIFQLSSGMTDSTSQHLLTNPHYQAIIVGFCGVFGSLLSIPASDGFGRRPCLIVSGSAVTLSLTSMAAYFWLYDMYEQWTLNCLGWIPLFGLVVFNVGHGIGYCAGPGALGNELLPTSVRASTMPIFTLTLSLFYFIVIQVLGDHNIEPHVMFTVYALIGVTGVLFFSFLVPETKKKSLEDIEQIWICKMTEKENGGHLERF